MFGSNLSGQQTQGGGLFGSTNTGGGLFGSGQTGQQVQPQQQGNQLWGGGLGGGNLTNPNPSGGLFGGVQQSTGSSLGSTGGGLFGQQQPKPSSNLFGGTSTTGMGFGQQQMPQNTMGQQTGSTGLFGGFNQPQIGQQSGMLTTQPTQGTGLFGQSSSLQNQVPNGQQGLQFGGMNQPGQMGSSIGSTFTFGSGLGGQQQQPQQQQQQQGGGLFGMIGQQPTGQQPTVQSGIFGQTTQLGQMGGTGLGQQGQGIFSSSSFTTPGGNMFNTSQPGMQGLQGQVNQGISGLQGQQGLGSNLFGNTMGGQGLGMGNTGMGGTNLTGQSSGLGGGLSNLMFSGQGQKTTQNQPFGSTMGGIGLGGNLNGMGMQSQQSSVMTGTYPYAYTFTKIQESSTQGGHAKIEHVNLIAISAMEVYSKMSIEELRYEDYKNKKQGLAPPKLGTSTGQVTQSSGFTSGGLFNQGNQPQLGMGQLGNQLNTLQTGQTQQGGLLTKQTGILGNQQTGFQSASSLFNTSSNQPVQTQLGQTQLGQNQPLSSGGLFGQQNLMGQAQTQTQFNQQPTQGGLFSGVSTTQPILGGQQQGGINQPSMTMQPSTSGGLFQSMSKPTQQTTSGGLFSNTLQTTTQPSTSVGGLFSSVQPQKPQMGGLGSTLQPSITTQSTNTGLFGNTNVGLNPMQQPSSSLFSQPQNQTTLTTSTGSNIQSGGLFSQMPTNTTQTPLFSGTSNLGQPTSIAQPQKTDLFTQNTMTQNQPPLFPAQSVDYKNFLTESMHNNKKSITDILNELNREVIIQDFLHSDYKMRERPREHILSESPYSVPAINPYYLNIRDQHNYHDYNRSDYYNPYDSFLKAKRINEKERRQNEFTLINKPIEDRKLKEVEGKNLKKSHSADSYKIAEKAAVSNLEFTFGNQISLGSEKTHVSKDIDINITVIEPVHIEERIYKINKNEKLSLIRKLVVEILKKKNPGLFKSISTNSFVLMKNYSVLKDSWTLGENNIRDRDTIYVVLKENYTTREDRSDYSNSRKVSMISKDSPVKNQPKAEKSKKKTKAILAPISSLPILTKIGYQTIPDMKEIYRMTTEELENVENFTIFNEHGKIEFKGKTNLKNLNLDQIVDIEHKSICLYQNGEVDFSPKVGSGLNKPAICHIYNCFPTKDINGEEQVKKDLHLASLQKICKNKKVIIKFLNI